jgi:hypothetical protein
MPYRIRKLPNRPQYKVYGEDGTPHSKKGLSLTRAKKQLTALNLAHLRKIGKIPKRKLK